MGNRVIPSTYAIYASVQHLPLYYPSLINFLIFFKYISWKQFKNIKINNDFYIYYKNHNTKSLNLQRNYQLKVYVLSLIYFEIKLGNFEDSESFESLLFEFDSKLIALSFW